LPRTIIIFMSLSTVKVALRAKYIRQGCRMLQAGSLRSPISRVACENRRAIEVNRPYLSSPGFFQERFD
jgi:hypothetical protein